MRSRSNGSRAVIASGSWPGIGDAVPDGADRLTVLLVGSGHAGHRDGDVGAEHALRALGHLLHRLLADHQLGGDAEHRALHVGGVRRDRTAERATGTGHVGEARADEPAGERLGDAERPAALLAEAQHLRLHRVVVDREHELAEHLAQLDVFGVEERRAPRLRSAPWRSCARRCPRCRGRGTRWWGWSAGRRARRSSRRAPTPTCPTSSASATRSPRARPNARAGRAARAC